jgi:2-polyprenyl-3-methyl-5-hydroxy-6-metoxy-1,4-benzoquinol methylase
MADGLAWEDCGCPLCGASASERHVAYRFPESAYHQCDSCSLVYLSPRVPEEQMLELYQQASYYAGDQSLGYETYQADEAVYRMTFARRLRELSRFKRAGSVLDIGCGTGLFLEAASAAGWQVTGLDVSPYARPAEATALAGQIRLGTLETVNFAPGSYDAVTMFDFFEHVYRPREFTRHLARILAPDGVAIIATPDYGSWMRRLLGRRTVSFKIPEHVAYYTRETLTRAVSDCFDVTHVEPIGQYCTTDFVGRRLTGLSSSLGSAFRFGVRAIGASGWIPYVPSGSLLAVLTKRDRR